MVAQSLAWGRFGRGSDADEWGFGIAGLRSGAVTSHSSPIPDSGPSVSLRDLRLDLLDARLDGFGIAGTVDDGAVLIYRRVGSSAGAGRYSPRACASHTAPRMDAGKPNAANK